MTIASWRDASLILLAIEAIIIALIPGLAFYFSWKGLRIATSWLRATGLPEGQRYSRLMKEVTQRYSKKVVRPVVKIETTLTQTSQTLNSVTTIPKQRTRR